MTILWYFTQIRAILRNRTAIEDWILEKAVHRRGALERPFIYPYNLGRWNNFKQVAEPNMWWTKYLLSLILRFLFFTLTTESLSDTDLPLPPFVSFRSWTLCVSPMGMGSHGQCEMSVTSTPSLYVFANSYHISTICVLTNLGKHDSPSTFVTCLYWILWH